MTHAKQLINKNMLTPYSILNIKLIKKKKFKKKNILTPCSILNIDLHIQLWSPFKSRHSELSTRKGLFSVGLDHIFSTVGSTILYIFVLWRSVQVTTNYRKVLPYKL